jgi:flagellar motor component MotA
VVALMDADPGANTVAHLLAAALVATACSVAASFCAPTARALNRRRMPTACRSM